MTLSTRRSFLVRSGAALAATGLASAGFGAPAPVPSPSHGHRGSLDPERRARYARLVRAVAALEGGRAGRAYVERATGDFQGWYERNANLRPMADHVLDAVETAGGARRLLADPGADPVTATEAFALARPPFAPDRA